MTSPDRPANVAALAAQLESTLEFYFDRMDGLDDMMFLRDLYAHRTGG